MKDTTIKGRRIRLNRHSAHPYHCGGEVDEGEEASVDSVEACGEAPKVLKLVEVSFYPVTRL